MNKELLNKIRAQQGAEGTDVWMIGEQLLEIAEREPASAALIEKDLDVASMSLTAAAVAMKAFADKKRAGMKERKNCVCVITPKEADGVLRRFYGLPEAGEVAEPAPAKEVASTTDSGTIDLSDFF